MTLPTTSLLKGKTCLVTGATRGLGLHTAIQLASHGAAIVIAGRSQERLQAAAAAIRTTAPGSLVETLHGDLSAQADVRRVAAQFTASHPTLDVLVNNVGLNSMKFRRSPDGIEHTWALNYLNHFLLTNLLLSNLRRAAEKTGEARIVEVTSSMYRFASSHFAPSQSGRGYNGVKAYAQSKRAMLVFVNELTRRLAGSGITANAVTPGAVKTSIASENPDIYRLIMSVINRFALPVEEGAKPIVRLCADPHLRTTSGAYYTKYDRRSVSKDISSPITGQRLWQLSAQAVGLPTE